MIGQVGLMITGMVVICAALFVRMPVSPGVRLLVFITGMVLAIVGATLWDKRRRDPRRIFARKYPDEFKRQELNQAAAIVARTSAESTPVCPMCGMINHKRPFPVRGSGMCMRNDCGEQ